MERGWHSRIVAGARYFLSNRIVSFSRSKLATLRLSDEDSILVTFFRRDTKEEETQAGTKQDDNLAERAQQPDFANGQILQAYVLDAKRPELDCARGTPYRRFLPMRPTFPTWPNDDS